MLTSRYTIRSVLRTLKTVITDSAQRAPLKKATRPPQAWEESVMKASREMKARPTDIFIVGYPKAGVHLTGQMAHIVRSRGNNTNDFQSLSDVVPFIYMLDSHDIPFDANQVYEPRLFLSHDRKDRLPTGGKYIYLLRDPLDVFNAFVPFMRSMSNFPEMDENILFTVWLLGSKYSTIPHDDYFSHMLSWLEHANDPNVLYLFYNDLITQKAEATTKIAQFMGIDLGQDELINDLIETQSSHDFMVKNDDKFNSFDISSVWNKKFGYPPNSGEVQIIRPDGGVSGQGKQRLSRQIIQNIDGLWDHTLKPKTGFANFQQLEKKYGIAA